MCIKVKLIRYMHQWMRCWTQLHYILTPIEHCHTHHCLMSTCEGRWAPSKETVGPSALQEHTLWWGSPWGPPTLADCFLEDREYMQHHTHFMCQSGFIRGLLSVFLVWNMCCCIHCIQLYTATYICSNNILGISYWWTTHMLLCKPT